METVASAVPDGYGATVSFSLTTERLRVRHWTVDDADSALTTYGVADVTGWLTPATDRIGDLPAMRSVLQAWVEAQANMAPPRGRWAIERLADGAVVGGLAIRLLPPRLVDLEISFQLRPEAWGNGYATEAAGALIPWAFTQSVGELYAVALPHNTRAIATSERLGMQWVGETTKYYDGRTLQVHRIRPGDLQDSRPATAPS
ncbi:MAG: GNAT family N-acetyltransferase [Pseudonocardia sp.]|nr:GNAT family N-acetyltransferase [Pseudonocardia sp.]